MQKKVWVERGASRVIAGMLIVFLISALLVVPQTAYANDVVDESEVIVSADNSAVAAENVDFALDNFWRAQVGSNRPINEVYYGYAYYSGDAPVGLVMIATTADVVVYCAPNQMNNAFDFNSPEQQNALQEMLLQIDTKSADGSKAVTSNHDWHFTQEDRFVLNGVEYRFNQELKSGSFYSCVLGDDGSDITDSENPKYVRLSHADFGNIVPAEQVELVAAASGWFAFTNFLSEIDYSPLWVTLKTTGVALVFIFVLGLAAAYFSLRIPRKMQDIFDTIFTIPMVLPPTVCGFLLLLALGKNSPVGAFFIEHGLPLVSSWPATVIAAVVVAFPLMYRSARGAFEGLDQNMLDAARTLGWSNKKVFFRLMLPLSWSSIAAGTVLAMARALGEFGATLFLAGNYVGVTRTIPIAIYYEWMGGRTDIALFWTIVIIIFCFIVIFAINIISRRTTKYRKPVSE